MTAAALNALNVTLRPVPRVRFKNILLATDFGSASAAAHTYAILLARMFGAHLFVLHVDEGRGLAKDSGNAERSRSAIGGTDLAFRNLEKFFAGSGVRFTFLMETGDVRETLNRIADEHEIDLILVGTHGRHGLSYLLFGSIAESLGRSCTRPVITVGPKAMAGCENSLRTILYVTDFSEESRIALPYASSLAQEFRADLTVFHAAPAAERLVSDRRHVETCLLNQLKNVAPQSRFPWCTVRHVIAFGETVTEILRQARDEKADLIVLGLHNSVRFTSHLPERLGYRILCDAPCPVLSVLPSSDELTATQLPGTLLKQASWMN